MAMLAIVALGAISRWSISIGDAWIVLMLIGMGLGFVIMDGFMWLSARPTRLGDVRPPLAQRTRQDTTTLTISTAARRGRGLRDEYRHHRDVFTGAPLPRRGRPTSLRRRGPGEMMSNKVAKEASRWRR